MGTGSGEVRPLREWRAARFWTLRELSEQSRVSVNTIFNLEHGLKIPRFSTVRKIAAALGVEPLQIAEVAELRGEGAREGTRDNEAG